MATLKHMQKMLYICKKRVPQKGTASKKPQEPNPAPCDWKSNALTIKPPQTSDVFKLIIKPMHRLNR